MSERSFVTLRHGGRTCKTLELTRTPIYLRFTIKNSDFDTLDALNNLEDVIEDGEICIAAKLTSRGTLHLDKTVNGRRVGEWLQTVGYHSVDVQPSQEVMRDNDLWRAWVMGRVDEEKTNEHSNP